MVRERSESFEDADQDFSPEVIEIEARLQKLIDSWADDQEPTRFKVRKHHERSAREKIDRWMEERALQAELEDEHEFRPARSLRHRLEH